MVSYAELRPIVSFQSVLDSHGRSGRVALPRTKMAGAKVACFLARRTVPPKADLASEEVMVIVDKRKQGKEEIRQLMFFTIPRACLPKTS